MEAKGTFPPDFHPKGPTRGTPRPSNQHPVGNVISPHQLSLSRPVAEPPPGSDRSQHLGAVWPRWYLQHRRAFQPTPCPQGTEEEEKEYQGEERKGPESPKQAGCRGKHECRRTQTERFPEEKE